MPMTVLVTGANGFLGRHLVAELLRRNYRVRALVRPAGRAGYFQPPPLGSLPVEVWEGDISQPATVAGAAAGCGAIIHAAALARVNPLTRAVVLIGSICPPSATKFIAVPVGTGLARRSEAMIE